MKYLEICGSDVILNHLIINYIYCTILYSLDPYSYSYSLHPYSFPIPYSLDPLDPYSYSYFYFYSFPFPFIPFILFLPEHTIISHRYSYYAW